MMGRLALRQLQFKMIRPPPPHRRNLNDACSLCQWTEHALTNLLVCRSCSEVACSLYRPLACVMARACAHRNLKAELSKFEFE